jgi:GABA(A) receptor-associated protein
MSDFKTKFSFEQRKSEAIRIKNLYKDRIPIVIEQNKKNNMPEIDKHKFLVPVDITVGQFMQILRKRIDIKPDAGIYIFIANTIPSMTTLMGELYKEYKDKDEFLYMSINTESTFG